MHQYPYKRAVDLIVAIPMALAFAPVIVVIYLVLRLRVGRPVLFVQRRIGLHGKIFALYKFRTMRDTRDGAGELLSDEVRLTKLGRWLRRTSLDELPQLWNVLKGDMSIIGPRPLLPEYLTLYTPFESRRHAVLPGMSGWAQIHGRNSLSWDEQFCLDVWYVNHLSFRLDIQILLFTVRAVLMRKGVEPEISVTKPLFRGSQKYGRN